MAKRKLLLLATTMVVKEKGHVSTISVSTEADENNDFLCSNRAVLSVHAQSLRDKIKNGETDEES